MNRLISPGLASFLSILLAAAPLAVYIESQYVSYRFATNDAAIDLYSPTICDPYMDAKASLRRSPLKRCGNHSISIPQLLP
jgi:hypothetical protein